MSEICNIEVFTDLSTAQQTQEVRKASFMNSVLVEDTNVVGIKFPENAFPDLKFSGDNQNYYVVISTDSAVTP